MWGRFSAAGPENLEGKFNAAKFREILEEKPAAVCQRPMTIIGLFSTIMYEFVQICFHFVPLSVNQCQKHMHCDSMLKNSILLYNTLASILTNQQWQDAFKDFSTLIYH